MFLLPLLLLLPLLSHGDRLTPEENRRLQTTCGQTENVLSRSNGPRTNQSDAPFSVAIGTGPAQIFCSGSFISSRHVLTAAHCITSINGYRGPLYAMVTENVDKEESEFQYAVLEQLQIRKAHYPWYYANVYTLGDIALLEVDISNKFSSQPACLPEKDLSLGSEVHLYGYGINVHDETAHKPLGVLRTVTSKTEFCPLFGSFEICFKGFPLLACGGDSGGSLVSTIQDRVTLNGVMTKINHLCRQNVWNEAVGYLNMGTSVFYHLDWICHASGVCPTAEVEKSAKDFEFVVKTKYRTVDL